MLLEADGSKMMSQNVQLAQIRKLILTEEQCPGMERIKCLIL